MPTLNEIKIQIKDILAKDIGEGVDALKQILNPDSRDYDNFIHASGRYYGIKNEQDKGLISFDNAQVPKNQIRATFISLIESLEEDDLLASAFTMPLKQVVKTPAPNNNNPYTQTPIPLKKTVLFICSSPKGGDTLDFGNEFRRLKDAKASSPGRDNFEIEIETGVLATDFIRKVMHYKPSILHITMHASKTEGLCFEDDGREEVTVSKEDFAYDIETIMKRHSLELVVISACNSVGHAEAIKDYVEYAIGMQDFIPDDLASTYARNFYGQLFDGDDIPFAHDAGISGIRKVKHKYKGKVPNHEIPVLFIKNT